jgi:hypothetical protein
MSETRHQAKHEELFGKLNHNRVSGAGTAQAISAVDRAIRNSAECLIP